jgi:hypothetical protein
MGKSGVILRLPPSCCMMAVCVAGAPNADSIVNSILENG